MKEKGKGGGTPFLGGPDSCAQRRRGGGDKSPKGREAASSVLDKKGRGEGGREAETLCVKKGDSRFLSSLY